MSFNHYFTKHPTSTGGRHSFTAELRGFEVTLVTEAGVFSRERVDRGTRLLIKHMEVKPTDRLLDLGCGYGPVGVIAGKLAPEGHITLIDINQRAVELARENLRANGITDAEVFQGDGFASIGDRLFDIIALNPPIRAGLAVVHSLIEQAYAHLACVGLAGSSLRADEEDPMQAEACATLEGEGGGRFYLVGRTRQGVIRIAEKMGEVFGNVTEVAKGGGYRLYRSVR